MCVQILVQALVLTIVNIDFSSSFSLLSSMLIAFPIVSAQGVGGIRYHILSAVVHTACRLACQRDLLGTLKEFNFWCIKNSCVTQ